LPEAPAQAAQAAAESLGLDASDLLVAVDPAPAAGDLKAELERFTTVEACVAERARLDPLVGDAIEALGYDTFLRDACRMLGAVKVKAIAGCLPIVASGLRERCETLVALAAGDASLCPMLSPSQTSLGRRPACLAAVTRDPRPCRGAIGARTTCEAIASGDVGRCASARAGEDPSRCRREAVRVASLLGTQPSKAWPDATARLQVTPRGSAPTPPKTSWDLSEGSAGVVLVEIFDGTRLELGAEREALADERGGRLRGGLVLPRAPEGVARIERLELQVPDLLTLSCPSSRCEVQATAKREGDGRGAALDVRVTGTAKNGDATYDVAFTLRTFVRDVVDIKRR